MNEASSVRAAAKATELLTLDDVRAAAARIEGAVVRTPMLRSQTLSEISGADIWLKFENHQFTAAYKERGALNALLHLNEEQRARGVIALRRDLRRGLCTCARTGKGTRPNLCPPVR